MKNKIRFAAPILGIIAVCLMLPGIAHSAIRGIEGTTFNLVAKDGYIQTGDGYSLYFWGYANADSVSAAPQYPGPTLIVEQGATVTINLTNQLDVPVSIVFPGHTGVTSTGDTAGLLTNEADPLGGTAQYTFAASEPGTYMYHSGSIADLAVEMGLVGAIIVRPASAMQAYNHPDSTYDREFLFLLTEMDPYIHILVELGYGSFVDNSDYFPVLWFINGRNAPDTMAPAGANWLPTQPYNCMPMMHPGERILLRFIGGGRDMHPFHHHGNNAITIAQDGRLLESNPGVSGPDLAESDFTEPIFAGHTLDAIFTWTGAGLGWDFYGHSPGDPLEPNEDPADHGKPFPVVLPGLQDLAFGGVWSGSPFLGKKGPLPPGEGINNLHGAYYYMWHSHTEKEMTNWDIFPGGMMTMLMIHHPDTVINE